VSPERNPGPGLLATICCWWKERETGDGFWLTLKQFTSVLWEFTRESTASRRRQRYGDMEYDWDYRVNTTSATVGRRDRLLGLFHSPYQPTEPALFREMLASLVQASPMPSSPMAQTVKIDLHEFSFIDVGSGKGRALLMAADYPFRRILGIELLPELHRTAEENIGKYKSDSQQCFTIECLLGDACEFEFPPEPTLVYLFNPLPESGLVRMTRNLEHSLQQHPRRVFVLYHNPLLEHVLARSAVFKKIAGSDQYSVFSTFDSD
jgi:hypothetical protein